MRRFLLNSLAILIASIPVSAEFTSSFPGTPWNGTDWVSKKITVTNSARNPIYLSGIRFDTPAKVWTGSSQAAVSTLNSSSPYRTQMILNNMEVNFTGNDATTFEVTGSPNGKDGTPSNPSYLVRNGSHFWPLEIPYSPPVKVNQIDSIIKTADFYNEKLGILDTLGQRGGSMNGGMIDSWFGLTQLQSALPTKPFYQNSTWMTFEPKAYGNSMYMMALSAMQEYFNIDMQMLIAKGGKENMAGMILWNTLGNTYGDRLGKIYGTGGNGLMDVDFGPFSVETQTFNDYVIKGHPKFYPLAGTTGNSDYYVTTKGTSYCDLDKPNVVNAAVICCLYNWYTFQLGLHSSDFAFTKLITDGKDRQGAMKLALWAFNRGLSCGWLNTVSASNVAALDYKKLEDFPGITERTYIDGIVAALDPIVASARNSVNLGGTEPIYDDTISLVLIEKFLFGTGGSGLAGTSNEGGLLVHFDLTTEKNKQLWIDVEQAFGKLKGKAPSTKSAPSMISYRYDFLTILRVIKQYIDITIPVPSNYKFAAWENSHSAKTTTFAGENRDKSFPEIIEVKKIGTGVDLVNEVTVSENGTIRSVDWTMDTTLTYWSAGISTTSAIWNVQINNAATTKAMVGTEFKYWIRATDTWGNAEIKQFSGIYVDPVLVGVSSSLLNKRQSIAITSFGKQVTVSGTGEITSIELFNLRGQSVAHREISSTICAAALDFNDLATGTYIVKVLCAKNETFFSTCMLR